MDCWDNQERSEVKSLANQKAAVRAACAEQKKVILLP
jgi:hypothetical protein